MKKAFAILICIAIIFTFAGCGGASQAELDEIKAENERLKEQLASMQQATQPTDPATPPTDPATEPFVANTAQETLRPTEEVTDSDKGSRKNPATIGDTITVTQENWSFNGVYTIALTEVISGDEAWQMILNENRYNDEPAEGQQYIMAKFHVEFLEDRSGEDTPLELYKYDFDYSTSDYRVEDLPSVVAPEPVFDLTLYEGASGEGWVIFLADLSESSPKALFGDTVWFNLS